MPVTTGFVWNGASLRPALGPSSSSQYPPEHVVSFASRGNNPAYGSRDDSSANAATLGHTQDLEPPVQGSGLDLVHLRAPPHFAAGLVAVRRGPVLPDFHSRQPPCPVPGPRQS